VDAFLAARAIIALSLGFHIIFAVAGVGLPLMAVFAEIHAVRKHDDTYLQLAKSWSKLTAVLFAVGAVSGTVLSFELGILFPAFMKQFGSVFGIPFALEGFAFFIEAIFLGIYLYGWNRMTRLQHILAGAVTSLGGLASAVFVTTANAWMNVPTGFKLVGNQIVDVDPLAVISSPFVLHEVLHMVFSAYLAVGLGVAAIHGYAYLKSEPGLRTFHRKALSLAINLAIPFALLQPIVGHIAGQMVAKHQPLKFAAMERHYVTESGAALAIGGIVDDEARSLRYAIKIPAGLSFLATNTFDGVVRGLDEFPSADWPNPIVHYSFQLMVALGSLIAAAALWIGYLMIRRKTLAITPFFVSLLAFSTLASFACIELGWIVTEVGRQPWIVYNLMRTVQSVEPLPSNLNAIFGVVCFVYSVLALAVIIVLKRLLFVPHRTVNCKNVKGDSVVLG